MAKPPKRRRLYPMPVEAIVDHPEIVTLSAAGYGMLMRLAHHYWYSECRPLPESEREIKQIIRADLRMWKVSGATIKRIFQDIKPDLDHYFEVRLSRQNSILVMGEAGRRVKTEKAMLRRLALPEIANNVHDRAFRAKHTQESRAKAVSRRGEEAGAFADT